MEGCLGEQKFSRARAQEKRAKGGIPASHRPSKGRVGLSDITNTQRPLSSSKSTTLSSEMDAIQNLQKENMMLRRLIDERNKIIEVTALEVQKLRVNLQKVYTQNWQLAKANSQMLAEVNSGKDMFKQQQHEHGCAMALLRAKNSELEEKLNNKIHQIIPEEKLENQIHQNIPEAKGFNCDEVHAMSPTASTCGKATSMNRRHQSKNTTLSVKSTEGQQVLGKLDKRRGRSSANKAGLIEHMEHLFDLDEAKFSDLPVPDEVVHEDFPASCSLSVASASTSDRELKEVEEAVNIQPQNVITEEPKSLFERSMITQVQNGCSSVEKPMKTEKRRSKRSSAILLESGTSKSLKVEDARILKEAKQVDFPAAVKMEENGEQRWSQVQPLQGRRSMRIAAVEKVISYKEKRINIKERRE